MYEKRSVLAYPIADICRRFKSALESAGSSKFSKPGYQVQVQVAYQASSLAGSTPIGAFTATHDHGLS